MYDLLIQNSSKSEQPSMIEGQWFPGGKLWLAKVVLNIVMKPGWDE